MKKIRILWADDEIELLRGHVIFLEEKGFEVTTATSGDDAIELVKSQLFDLLFLDENMPGKTGLDTLEVIKEIAPSLPVVMITKSEEEEIMEEAIGAKIADYLIKPVHPKQVLMIIKKHTEQKQLVTRKTTSGYQMQFSEISRLIDAARSFNDWKVLYEKLVFWELELERHGDEGMKEVLRIQKYEANRGFSKFIQQNYSSWFGKAPTDKPLLSPGVFRHTVLPLLEKGEKVLFVVIDNLRLDQWKTMELVVGEFMEMVSYDLYCSILPTATHYARNAIFAGLMPLDISKYHPDLWKFEDEEGSKNVFEQELLQRQLTRLGKKIPFRYEKINHQSEGQKILEQISDLDSYSLNVLVYNFVDMISHARTDMEMIKELAGDEAAYRSLSLSWFRHSSLLGLLKEMAGRNFTLVLTTDHGSVRVNNPVKVIGDRESSVNLRYKTGRNLNYPPKQVMDIRDPESIQLPRNNLTSSFIFAMNDDFMAFPKNYHHYVGLYRNTFQHGGISLEEMMVPLVVMRPR